jgi:hypothetical protein
MHEKKSIFRVSVRGFSTYLPQIKSKRKKYSFL